MDSPCSGHNVNTHYALQTGRSTGLSCAISNYLVASAYVQGRRAMRSARIRSAQIPRMGPLSGLRSFRALPMGRVPWQERLPRPTSSVPRPCLWNSPSSHFPFVMASAVTHQPSCHVRPQRFKPPGARGNFRPGRRIKQRRWMPTFAPLVPGWRGTAGDHLRLHGPALAHYPDHNPNAEV